MAARAPLNRLVLTAHSRADDMGFAALADITNVLGGTDEARLIGGHMVQLHVDRWRLGADLYRETQDARPRRPAGRAPRDETPRSDS